MSAQGIENGKVMYEATVLKGVIGVDPIGMGRDELMSLYENRQVSDMYSYAFYQELVYALSNGRVNSAK